MVLFLRYFVLNKPLRPLASTMYWKDIAPEEPSLRLHLAETGRPR